MTEDKDTKRRLLEAAMHAAGGKSMLARRLGLTETVIDRYMDNSTLMPDAVLMFAIDVLLEHREHGQT